MDCRRCLIGSEGGEDDKDMSVNKERGLEQKENSNRKRTLCFRKKESRQQCSLLTYMVDLSLMHSQQVSYKVTSSVGMVVT